MMKKIRLLKVAIMVLPMLFFSLVGFSQTIMVQGSVKDEKGATLPGVAVLEKGTTNGTITDVNGRYSISVSPSAKALSFSFIGMNTAEVAIAGQTQIDVIDARRRL
jgi:anaerobic glycerol-3-phosphate dehydrogenase